MSDEDQKMNQPNNFMNNNNYMQRFKQLNTSIEKYLFTKLSLVQSHICRVPTKAPTYYMNKQICKNPSNISIEHLL